jgi:hypothetical protein
LKESVAKSRPRRKPRQPKQLRIDYAARRRASNIASHLLMRFQLANVRLTVAPTILGRSACVHVFTWKYLRCSRWPRVAESAPPDRATRSIGTFSGTMQTVATLLYRKGGPTETMCIHPEEHQESRGDLRGRHIRRAGQIGGPQTRAFHPTRPIIAHGDRSS